MIRRTSGASRFNIYKFSDVLGLGGMEKVVSKRDDFVVDALFYLSQGRDLSTGVICSDGSLAVIQDEMSEIVS